jgi:hypothetical protein
MTERTDRFLANLLTKGCSFVFVVGFFIAQLAISAWFILWLAIPPGSTKAEKDMEIYKQLIKLGETNRAAPYYHRELDADEVWKDYQEERKRKIYQ